MSQEVPEALQWRGLELFKDMAEEFISNGKTELSDGFVDICLARMLAGAYLYCFVVLIFVFSL